MVVGLAAAVALGLLLFLASGTISPWIAHSQSSVPLQKSYLNLTIAYDPHTGVARFTVPNLSIPAHTLVEVRITNYDPTVAALLVPWDNRVIGTVGGTEELRDGAAAHPVASIPAIGVSHTLSVLDSSYNISVPIPPALSPGMPSVISFQLALQTPETTTWACMCHCMDGQMQDQAMYGPFTVG